MIELEPEILERMSNFNKNTYGYSAIMVMQKEDGTLNIVERKLEPCYGFLRKYKATHGDKATQSENKPGDLHNPFPDGVIQAVSIPNSSLESLKGPLLDYILGPDSPYITGFGKPENLQLTRANGRLTGFILLETDVDPTVFINLCKTIHAQLDSNHRLKFEALLKEGMTNLEAFTCIMFNGNDWSGQVKADTYVTAPWPDLNKMKDGKANNLSIGTWKAGFDYSRRHLQDIWKRDTVKGKDMGKPLHERLAEALKVPGKPWAPNTPAVYAAKAKEVLNEWSKM